VVSDLIEAGLLEENEPVLFNRPRVGTRYEALINADGTFTLSDGTTWNSPSLAAMRSANLTSYDGWHAWQVPRLNGARLNDLRQQLVDEYHASHDTTGNEPS
jgi:hypothetical protein